MESAASSSKSLLDQHQQPIQSVPRDIILDILSRIPVKFLLRFKSVCKSWYNLITHDTSFIRMHLNKSINVRRYNLLVGAGGLYTVDCFRLQFDRVTVELDQVPADCPLESEGLFSSFSSQSCNGIFLICGYTNLFKTVTSSFKNPDVFYLWNPSTKEHKILPTTLSQVPQTYIRALGLGYDSFKNDYKVIQITQNCVICNNEFPSCRDNDCSCKSESIVQVYSLQTNSCRRIQGLPDFVTNNLHLEFSNSGVFVMGAIHWWFRVGDFYRMIAFNVSNEEFNEVPLPDNMTITESTMFTFGAFEDSLCLYHHFQCESHVDMFMMKTYGVKESWTKIFSYDLSFEDYFCVHFKPLWISDKDVHIWMLLWNKNDGNLAPFLDFRSKRWSIQFARIYGITGYVRIEPWIESLVSLNQNSKY